MFGIATTLVLLLTLAIAACSAPPTPAATPPQTRPDLAGMWSDPPRTALDSFCFMACTETGLKHLAALLDDPANDARPYEGLMGESVGYQAAEYLRPRMTDAGLATSPLDPLADRGYLYCEPWGFARQAFAPHQLEIKQDADSVDLHYGEWDAHRTVYLDGRSVPADQVHTPLGYSVGHYEGDTLVVETTHVTEGDGTLMAWDGRHSDQLTAVERYRRPNPERLELTATLTDPWALREPVEFKKVWRFAPDQEIGPYDSCEPAAAKSAEGKAQ
ncbi:MAG: hypothetical protein ABI640_19725 [Gammaproteobacteria bacterium]